MALRPDLTPWLLQLRLVQQWLLISPLAGSLTAKGMRVRYRFVRLMADRAPRPLALDVKARYEEPAPVPDSAPVPVSRTSKPTILALFGKHWVNQTWRN